MRPDPAAQHRHRPLTLTPALYGFRLAFVGGTAFDPVEEPEVLEVVTRYFLTRAQGEDAFWAARAAELSLARFFSGARMRP